ncbi:MAG TPA: hypothetical protein GX707_17080 [Epulopiscium sp.]|nr:hypothetical protein [Candidatus Epulonipiscium sp.]
MYTVLDLIEKVINIEQKGYEMYTLISLMEDIDENIKVVARILASEEKRHEQIYIKLKEEVEAGEVPPIDFSTYDKASNLISSFRYPVMGHLKDIEQLLNIALDFEEQSISLVISIQGLLIKEYGDSVSVTYDALTQIIEQEKKHIQNIERFLR